MPVADRKARVKALWSQKPQACAFTATYRPTESLTKKATSGDRSKSRSSNATSTDETRGGVADSGCIVRGFTVLCDSGPRRGWLLNLECYLFVHRTQSEIASHEDRTHLCSPS